MRTKASLAIAAIVVLTGCANTSASMSEAEVQAKRVGAPLLSDSSECKGEIKKLAMPAYPVDAARKGVQGWVLMRFDLDGSGRATAVVVEGSQPAEVFDANAVSAVQRSQFVQGSSRIGCKIVITFALS
jgi:TonB family protein